MIEWFLQPKNDTERSLTYAMKLYSANQLADEGFKRYLEKDDKTADRKLKELQTRKLARDQGLDYERFMSDDDSEENRTAQGAIAYGARVTKPKAAVRSVMRTMAPQAIADLERGPAAMARNVAELMRKFESGTIAQKFPKAAIKYASFL